MIQGEGCGYQMGNLKAKYRGLFGTVITMGREEGLRTLYSGLAPGLQRQMAFASIRIGMYDSVKQGYFNMFKVDDSMGLRIAAGVTTGGLAVACAQPTDVVKVRLQAGTTHYTGTFNAYKTIAAAEGVKGLWEGSTPNIARNSVVNASELVSYDFIKTRILAAKLLDDSLPCHFLSALGAGFITTVLASPIDVVKTRFMNSNPGLYRGALHCAMVMLKDNGIPAFYKGFVPSFTRLVSWNIVMFVCYEQLKCALMNISDISNIKTEIKSLSLPNSVAINGVFHKQADEYIETLLGNTFRFYTDSE